MQQIKYGDGDYFRIVSINGHINGWFDAHIHMSIYSQSKNGVISLLDAYKCLPYAINNDFSYWLGDEKWWLIEWIENVNVVSIPHTICTSCFVYLKWPLIDDKHNIKMLTNRHTLNKGTISIRYNLNGSMYFRASFSKQKQMNNWNYSQWA